MEPGWTLDGIGRNYTYSTPNQLSADCRSVHLYYRTNVEEDEKWIKHKKMKMTIKDQSSRFYVTTSTLKTEWV